MTTLLQGFCVGLLTCVPLGPIGLFAAQRTLINGRLVGISSLLGASTADGIYCVLAGLGIQAVSTAVYQRIVLVQVVGGLILSGVGLYIFFSQPERKPLNPPVRGMLEAFTSTLLLVLANPMPVLVFASAFAAFGIRGWSMDTGSTLFMVIGVFLGSAAWSPLLATGVGFFGPGLNPKQLRAMNRICGGLITGIGLALGTMGLFNWTVGSPMESIPSPPVCSSPEHVTSMDLP